MSDRNVMVYRINHCISAIIPYIQLIYGDVGEDFSKGGTTFSCRQLSGSLDPDNSQIKKMAAWLVYFWYDSFEYTQLCTRARFYCSCVISTSLYVMYQALVSCRLHLYQREGINNITLYKPLKLDRLLLTRDPPLASSRLFFEDLFPIFFIWPS